MPAPWQGPLPAVTGPQSECSSMFPSPQAKAIDDIFNKKSLSLLNENPRTGPGNLNYWDAFSMAAVKVDDEALCDSPSPHWDIQNTGKLKSNLRMATEMEKALITGQSQSLNRKTKLKFYFWFFFLPSPLCEIFPYSQKSTDLYQRMKTGQKSTRTQSCRRQECGVGVWGWGGVWRGTWHQGKDFFQHFKL